MIERVTDCEITIELDYQQFNQIVRTTKLLAGVDNRQILRA